MRPGELFGLHWPEVDLATPAVSVRRSLEEIDGKPRLKTPKTDRQRTIPIAPHTAAALAEHRERMRAEGRDVEAGPVFVSTSGGWLLQANFYRRSFLKILKRAGLLTKEGKPLIRPYDLRHTCATLLLLKGVNVKVVSERLGHESIETTLKHYAHVLPAMQQAAVTAVAELFGGDCPPVVPQALGAAGNGQSATEFWEYA